MTSWFVTKNGRLFTRTIVGVTAVSVVGTHIAFNGPLLNIYQSVMQMYRYGDPKPLPPEVLQTANSVVNDCKAKKKIFLNEGKGSVKFFASIGKDLFHAGCTSLPWGAIIGLPFGFGIKDKSDIDLLNLKVLGKEDIDWSSEGDELLQSLILSENARKFAIAREVIACREKDVFMESLILACAVLLPARVVQKTNKSGETFKKFSFNKRALFYTALYGASFIIFKCLKDINKHDIEKEIDQNAASLGSEYLEGGIEFYEKTLSKNKALRKLMGPEGERFYDLNGNESHFMFLPHLLLSKRVKYLQDMKEKQAEAAS